MVCALRLSLLLHRPPLFIRSYSSVPYQIAIVGAGPAGFYTASRLLKKNEHLQISFFEKRIAPFGLVRYGVAPDHPEVKNCIHAFTEIGNSPRVQYFGQVEFNKDFSLKMLKSKFDAVVICIGALSEKNVTIPGEENSRENVFTAHQVVGWYNGMPEYVQLPIDLSSSDTAVIFGHGNVALDIARILLSPLDRLRKTDISKVALDKLEKSKIRHVHLVGRRGPLQVSFSSAEFRELLHLPDCQYHTDRDLLASIPATSDRPRQRLLQLMRTSLPSTPATKSWHLTFFHVPTHVDAKRSVTLTQTCLVDNKAQLTSHHHKLAAGLCIKSFGYLPHPIQDPSVFMAGWVQKCQGTLASTLINATQTAEEVLAFLSSPSSSTVPMKPGLTHHEVQAWVPHKRVVGWRDWMRLHQVEKELGTKLLSNESMLQKILFRK